MKLSELAENTPSTDGLTLDIAISTPTRSYASTFINLGIQIGMRREIISSFNKDAYFSDLKATPVGSELRYYEKPQLNGNSRRRIFRGTETDQHGVEWLLLQDKKNTSTTDKVNAARSYCVLNDEQQGIKTLKSITQLLQSVGDLASTQDAVAYTFSKRANIAIIGKINALIDENILTIGIQNDGIKSELFLKDITRIGMQTLLLSSMRDETIDQLNKQQPPIVVYESIAAANKYRDAYSPKVRIYMVDRSIPSIRDYRTCIEEYYRGRSPHDAPKISTTLKGIETLSFYTY